MISPYDEALAVAQKELAIKKAELHRLQDEVLRLQRTVTALTSLLGKPPEIDPAAGLAECVKQAIRRQSPAGLYPTTVRLELERAGYPFQDQVSPMASIHSTLKRLEKSGCIRKGKVDDKTAYFWKSDKRSAVAEKQQKANSKDGRDELPF